MTNESTSSGSTARSHVPGIAPGVGGLSDAEKASDWDACASWLDQYQRGLDPLTGKPYSTLQQRLVAAVCEAMWGREDADA